MPIERDSQRADYLTALSLADFAAYTDCQKRVDQAWTEADTWTRMSILNTARSERFSADRAITEYCDKIWRLKPQHVEAVKKGWEPAHNARRVL